MNEDDVNAGRMSSLNQIGVRDGQVWIVAEADIWRRAFGSIPSAVDIYADTRGNVHVFPGVSTEVRAWEISQDGGASHKHYLASRPLDDATPRVRSADSVTSVLEVTPDNIRTQSLEIPSSIPREGLVVFFGVALLAVMASSFLFFVFGNDTGDVAQKTSEGTAIGAVSSGLPESDPKGSAKEKPTQSEAIAEIVSEASGNESELLRVLDLPEGVDTSLVPIEVGSKTDSRTTLSWYSDHGLLIFGSVIDRQGRDLTRLVKSYHGMGQEKEPKQQVSPDDHNAVNDEMSSNERDAARRPNEVRSQRTAKDMSWPLSRVYEQIEESVSYFPNNEQDGRYIYVFVDPQCPYCEELYTDIMTSEDLDASVVRWVPVAVLGRSSLPKAAKLLSSERSADSLRVDAKEADSELAEKIVENTRVLLYSAEQVATPTLIWRSEDGVESYVGSPSKARLKDILNSISDANGGHNDERGSAAS